MGGLLQIDLYAVPKDWELDKIDIKYCQVYYDGVLQENISHRKGVVDTAVPAEIRFEDEFDLEQFFDCE